jgi:hypothetical protein
MYTYHLVFLMHSLVLLVSLFEYYGLFKKILESRTGIEERDFVNRLSIFSLNTFVLMIIPARSLLSAPGSVGSSIMLEGLLSTF